jgi:tetratricopeptide (TPR) repeat protein
VTDADNLTVMLDELRRAGEKPSRKLLDRLRAHGMASARPLIELATDERLLNADSSSPEVWAPLHAVRLLGELGAPEAIEPLLPLFDLDYDYLAEELPETFGGIGAPAVAPLRTLLFDRARSIYARGIAAEALRHIGQRHPATRRDVVDALVARLDPAESRSPDDETLNGFVIGDLLDLKAVEAEQAIRAAFREDRVDTSVVDLDWALKKLGLTPEPRAKRKPSTRSEEGLRLRLRCTACGYEREHRVGTVYYDEATKERRERGEPTPYSEWIVGQKIVCPKCGAVDQYQPSAFAMITLTAELLKMTAARKAGEPGAEADVGPVRFIRFGLEDGREMHPLEAFAMYREQIAVEPNQADLRERYGNALRFLGHREEAVEQFRETLRLEPANLEARLNLGRLARDAGDRAEARRMFESVIAEAPKSGLPKSEQMSYAEAAAVDLVDLVGARELAKSSRARPAPSPEPAPARSSAPAIPKVGRNDPCPCGSGKKYKKCHGR